MKRTCRILAILAIMIMVAVSYCFADGTEGGLNLLDTYPKEGSTGAAIENFDVKLYFDSEMTEDVLGDVNDDCFKLVDADGHVLPTIVLYSPKEEGVVLVLFDSNKENLDSDGKKITIQGDKEYTLTVSGTLKDNAGNTLGTDKVIKFTTINQRRNSLVSMGLMLVLYAGIIGFSLRNAKKNAEKKDNKEAKFNPYKEAKKTGKTVEEVMEKEQKKQARKAKKDDEDDDDDYEYEEEEPELKEGHYRVKTIRTVASGGSSYITGRKAEAEARAEREARYAKNKKKVKGKGKRK